MTLLFIGCSLPDPLASQLASQAKVTILDDLGQCRVLLNETEFCAILAESSCIKDRVVHLCNWLRDSRLNTHTPLVLLGSGLSRAEEVLGFGQSVRDILDSSVEPGELLARLELRIRDRRLRGPLLKLSHHLTLKAEQFRLIIRDQNEVNEIELTEPECRLLTCFMAEPNRIWKREDLLHIACNGRSPLGDRIIDVHVSKLRKKLGPMSNNLRSIYGVGYALSTDMETS